MRDDMRTTLNPEKIEALKIILSSKNTLVTARAGTGKSTLLRSLIYILVNRHKIDKNLILFLSFNKAVQEQNQEILKNDYGIDKFYGVRTFDSLAYQIVKTPGKVIDLLTGQKIINFLADIVKKQSFVFRLKYWWYLSELDKEYNINSKGKITTLLGEEVKSYGEKLIANFLFEHGLEYEYEPVFSWGENQYRPDFVATQGDLKVAIEYFGLRDPEYLKEAARKRDYWKQSGQPFVEIGLADFGKQKDNPGRHFLNTLEQRLKKAGLMPKALSEKDKVDKIFDSKVMIKRIAAEVQKFIDYAQAQRLSPADVLARLKDTKVTADLTKKDKFFNEFALSVYEQYLEHLKKSGQYDFARVIEQAAAIVLNTNGARMMNLGPDKNVQVAIKDLKWLLLDEFQDYSPAYHLLISAIQQVNPNARFVCVGDDWQAINGFAGSDTKYMAGYGAYFSLFSKSFLLTNFRSKSHIVSTGNSLMRGFGEKSVAQISDDDFCVKILEIKTKSDNDSFFIIQDYINKVAAIINRHPGKSIAVLHRNNKILGVTLDAFAGALKTKLNNQDKAHVAVSTIHQYKGKEEDIIIIIGATDWNHPMLHPERSRQRVLGLTDEKIKLEERRLFYVAITRAKELVYIITEPGNESPFIEDLSLAERPKKQRIEIYPNIDLIINGTFNSDNKILQLNNRKSQKIYNLVGKYSDADIAELLGRIKVARNNSNVLNRIIEEQVDPGGVMFVGRNFNLFS